MDFSVNTTRAHLNNTRLGWVNEPDGRGTWTISVTCVSTLLVCSWSVMHLNIPPKNTSKHRSLLIYMYWCMLGILGPELVLWAAWRQLLSAKALRDEMRDVKTKTPWTMVHGFYALMGGFVFDFDTSFEAETSQWAQDVRRLTLTAKGARLLAQCGHLPEISQRELEDKSKIDEIGKLLACLQAAWMLIQVCARLILHLPVTLLEVTTVGHVMCALILYTIWWYKPRKLEEPTVLRGDWAGPIAAFMLMSSQVGQEQMLPGFRVEKDQSEVAGLRFIEDQRASVATRQVNDADGISQRTNGDAASQPLAAGAAPSQATQISIERRDGQTTAKVDNEQQSAIALHRWRLACQSIEKYPAVRSLLQHPSARPDTKFELALAEYPEMPARCMQTADAEKHPNEKHPWLECGTQHLVTTVASNWPHDGMLRSANGLIMGATFWLASLAFGGVHMAAWFADFPTIAEAWLWRASSTYIAFSGLLWAVLHLLAEVWPYFWWLWFDLISGDAPVILAKAVVVVCGICGASYVFSRTFLIVEAFASLRSLPAAAFLVPEWTLGVPHIG